MPLTLSGSGAISGIDFAGSGVGLAHIATSSFTTAATVSLDNCFTSTYANYRIVLVSTTGGSGNHTLRFRASAADNSTANYNSGVLYATGATPASAFTSGATSMTYTSSFNGAFVFDVLGPQLAQNTYVVGASYYSQPGIWYSAGSFNATTQFDGFSFLFNGTGTGTVRVYGYIND